MKVKIYHYSDPLYHYSDPGKKRFETVSEARKTCHVVSVAACL